MLSVVQILLPILPAVPLRAWSQTGGKAGLWSWMSWFNSCCAYSTISCSSESADTLAFLSISLCIREWTTKKTSTERMYYSQTLKKIFKINSKYIGRWVQTQTGPSFFFMLVFLPVLLILFYLTTNRSGREILYIYWFSSKQDTCKSVGCKQVNRAHLKSARFNWNFY